MNYRHAFHAGNHADVLKHLVLSRIFALLSRKEAPFAYLDSHAGVGLYDLAGDQASRTGEWLQGIARIWQAETRPALLDDYLGVIRSLNPDGALRYYPGSPELARQLTREQDRLQLNEKHPEDGALLKDNMSGDRRVAVHRGEGWHVPRALMPTREKRVVLLIDPPFEQADELSRCVTALKEALGRMRQTIGVIWYPIKDERQLKRFIRTSPAAAHRNCCAPNCSSTPPTTPAAWPARAWPSPTRRGGWRMNCESCCPGWPSSWRRARVAGGWTG